MPYHRLRNFNIKELALYNGHDKEKIYIAYNGLVYDVTHSRMWHTGKNYEHWSGQALTEELRDAPQTEKVVERMEIVGVLLTDKMD